NDGLTNPTRTDSNIRSTQTYTANFAINTYTLTYTAGTNGALGGTTTQTVTHGSAGTEVIALPDANFHFVSWSDGVLTASRTESSVISSLAVTASFADCGEIVTDARDGNTYPTVKIGTQCWMAKNVAYLPSVVPATTGGIATPYYYVYGYQGTSTVVAKDQANYTIYGVLYNYPAALTACPVGWHLPIDAEYTTLSTYLGGDSVSGGKLKSSSTWDGSNSTGFYALAVGDRTITNLFAFMGSSGFIWTASVNGVNNAWYRNLYIGAPLYRFDGDRGYGMTVRCLKD
ncbi:MAG: FISUMP domain-containing protein, partial [Candidatus Falkowbacteria bacterium]